MSSGNFLWTCVSLALVFAGVSGALPKPDYSVEYLQSYGELNGKCESTKDCRPFGYVCRENKTCECDSMYAPDTYKTKCVGGVDQKCVYDEHCIEGAFCMNQAICKCKETTPIASEFGMACGAGTDQVELFRPLLFIALCVSTKVV